MFVNYAHRGASHYAPQNTCCAFRLGVRLWGVFNEEIMNAVYPLDTDGMTVNFPDKLKELTDRDGRL